MSWPGMVVKLSKIFQNVNCKLLTGLVLLNSACSISDLHIFCFDKSKILSTASDSFAPNPLSLSSKPPWCGQSSNRPWQHDGNQTWKSLELSGYHGGIKQTPQKPPQHSLNTEPSGVSWCRLLFLARNYMTTINHTFLYLPLALNRKGNDCKPKHREPEQRRSCKRRKCRIKSSHTGVLHLSSLITTCVSVLPHKHSWDPIHFIVLPNVQMKRSPISTDECLLLTQLFQVHSPLARRPFGRGQRRSHQIIQFDLICDGDTYLPSPIHRW